MTAQPLSAIRVEGGLLSAEYLHQIALKQALAQKREDYLTPAGLTLNDEIFRAWKITRALWGAESPQSPPAGQRHIFDFLRDALGYGDIKQYHPRNTLDADSAQTDDGIHIPTHITADGVIPLVIAQTETGLDQRIDNLIDGKKISPFNLLQTHLNNSHHRWGVICDGGTLRIMRSSTSLTRAAYIEADLNRIVQEGGNGHYADFALLYLCAHASRFAGGDSSPLEKWKRDSEQTGIRAHEKIQLGVKNALIALGSGFLQHKHNTALQQQLRDQYGHTGNLYRQLLWLVYRLIFLLVTEDRRLLQRDDASDSAKKAYPDGYSISRLRDRAARHNTQDSHDDLWEGVKYTFSAMQDPKNKLGLPAPGGLFENNRCQDLLNCRLSNTALLDAMHELSYFQTGKQLQRVNYRDMGADELGSIYEILLELIPGCTADNQFKFADIETADDNTRRATGSYYTTPTLVDELLDSALQPALDSADSEEAILKLRIIDPACGSGHFLIAAARRIAEKLLHLRDDGSGEAMAEKRRLALRDVISHCICGVDKNPMTLDLAKTALWLEAFDAKKPLTFLDHHLQCGDSLLGVYDTTLLAGGIREEAYKPVTGDDKKYCAALKKTNKKECPTTIARSLYATRQQDLAQQAAQIDNMPEDDLLQIEKKSKAYKTLEQKRAATGEHVAADMYVAAYLMQKQPHLPPPPTTNDVLNAIDGNIASSDTVQQARQHAAANSVFHWTLRYPDIFASGGFSVVLANPPWKRVKLREQVFFASQNNTIAGARNANERKRLIAQLNADDSSIRDKELWQSFQKEKRAADCASNYLRTSGNYPLTGAGDINTYALFAELCLRLGAGGSAGVIVPTNIATDDTTKAFFSHIMREQRLKILYDFENSKKLFPSVHSSFRFSLLALANGSSTPRFSIFAHDTSDLRDERRVLTLTPDQLRLVNPNTKTMPLYRTAHDRELCEKIYRAAPILWRQQQADSEHNPWQVKFQAMFHMSGDSKLFQHADAPGLVRLYEGKQMHQYDHRWAQYNTGGDRKSGRDITQEEKRNPAFTVQPCYWLREDAMLAKIAGIPQDLRNAIVKNTGKHWHIARDWLIGHRTSSNDISALLSGLSSAYDHCLSDQPDMKKAAEYAQEVPLTEQEITQLQQTEQIADFLRPRCPKWLMGWRNISNTTNELTLLSCILPLSAAGNSISLMNSRTAVDQRTVLYAMLNSYITNYTARQKICGTNLNYFYIKQLPILPPDAFTEEDLRAIVPAVAELSYTATDMKPFYDDIIRQNPAYDVRPASQQGKPYQWDDMRRATLRAQIEARIAHKYGISRDELRYLFDPSEIVGDDYPTETFRILKKNELEKHGEYRIRNLTLAAYDALTAAA